MIKEKYTSIRKSFIVEALSRYFYRRHITIAEYIDEFYNGKIQSRRNRPDAKLFLYL